MPPPLPHAAFQGLPDSVIAMNILWAIREYGPISKSQLFSMFNPGKTSLKVNSSSNMSMTDMTVVRVGHACDRLAQAGLIQLCSLSEDAENLTYEVSQTLPVLLNLLNISLTEYCMGDELPVPCQPIFGRPKVGAENPDIFVLMPFERELSFVYQSIVAAVTGIGFSCARADDFFSTGVIIDEVWSHIYNSRMCIADCTGRNPNVFYEIGLAHTLGRPCILLAQDIRDIPFDLKHRRIIGYQNDTGGLQKLEEALTNTLYNEFNSELTVESKQSGLFPPPE